MYSSCKFTIQGKFICNQIEKFENKKNYYEILLKNWRKINSRILDGV